MYLKSIEITGFKSFAKKSEFVFSSPISAIVGPNGSGKSNVAEAFRFVLGEQSMKSMRGKRGEDLIFNGTPDVPRVNRAAVKLVFDNSKKVFQTLDFDEVAIERTVERDGTNEYFVNGSKVRLKDILEILSTAHIGASGHHIISQGEADRILSSSAKERREMIEDALGLKVFQYKKEESERKLEKTKENREKVESLRREIAPHLRFLKKQMDKLAEGENTRRALLDEAVAYFADEELYIGSELENISSRRAPLEKDKDETEKKIATARAALSSASGAHGRSDELSLLERGLSEVRARAGDIVRSMGRIEGELSVLARESERRVEGESTVPLQNIESLFTSVKQGWKKALESLKPEDMMGAFRATENLFADFIKKHKGENAAGDREKEIKELEIKQNSLAKELDEARKKEQSLSVELATLSRVIEEQKESGHAAEKELYELLSKEKDLCVSIASLVQEESNLRLLKEGLDREKREVGAMVGVGLVENLRSFEGSRDRGANRQAQQERAKGIERLKIRLEESGLSNSGDIEKEYRETSERDAFLEREIADLAAATISLEEIIADLSRRLEEDFAVGIKRISEEFKKFFVLMFGGGDASITLLKKQPKPDEDELEDGIAGREGDISGIEVKVSLPRKKISGLMMLSGGERALTSIALLFAMSQVNPPPFIILDETDAALDESNSRKYSDMIESLSLKSQLVVITHNRETMSRAGVIYGVTMAGSGISKVLSIAFEEAEAVAK